MLMQMFDLSSSSELVPFPVWVFFAWCRQSHCVPFVFPSVVLVFCWVLEYGTGGGVRLSAGGGVFALTDWV